MPWTGVEVNKKTTHAHTRARTALTWIKLFIVPRCDTLVFVVVLLCDFGDVPHFPSFLLSFLQRMGINLDLYLGEKRYISAIRQSIEGYTLGLQCGKRTS